jgi:predicted MFS family arabinose efflux permease
MTGVPENDRDTVIVTHWPLVLMLVGAGVVVAFQIGKAPAALPLLRESLGLSLVTASWVISIFNAIGLVSGMIVGVLAERLGHRRVVLGGLVVVGVASALGALAQDGAMLLATRFLEGLGFMVVVVATPTLFVRVAAPRDAPLAFGFWGAYMPTGTGAMMALTPIIAAFAGWRGVWFANAALVLAFAVALAIATRGLHAGAASPRDLVADIRAVLGHRGPTLVALTFASYTGHFLAVFGFLPTLFIEAHGIGTALAATLGAVAVAINIPGNLLGGFLIRRGAKRWALIAIASTTMALCSTFFFAGGFDLATRYALALVVSFVGGMLPSTVLGLVPLVAPSPRHAAVTNGLVMQGSNLGQALGPPLSAALATALGTWSWTPLVLCASSALGILLALRIRRIENAITRT